MHRTGTKRTHPPRIARREAEVRDEGWKVSGGALVVEAKASCGGGPWQGGQQHGTSEGSTGAPEGYRRRHGGKTEASQRGRPLPWHPWLSPAVSQPRQALQPRHTKNLRQGHPLSLHTYTQSTYNQRHETHFLSILLSGQVLKDIFLSATRPRSQSASIRQGQSLEGLAIRRTTGT